MDAERDSPRYSTPLKLTAIVGLLISWTALLALDSPVQAQQTVRIEGRVIDESGQPVSSGFISADDIAIGCCEEFFTGPDASGRFQFDIPPAVYVITANPLAPLNPIRLRVDASGGNVSNLVLTVSTHSTPFLPDDPPKAQLIQISTPDTNGDIVVTGAPGSVPPNSSVALVTLDTGHTSVVEAEGNGSFSASLFAPPGTSILVKSDPLGANVGRFLVVNDEEILNSDDDLAALSGTILHVSDPSATGAEPTFSGAGLTHFASVGESPLPAWTFQGVLNGQTFSPGGTLSVQGSLRIVSSALQGAGTMRAGIRLSLERLSGPNGHGTLAQNTYASVFLTPTGLPIERKARGFNESLDQFVFVDILKAATDQAEAAVDMALPIPVDLPAGFYRPLITFNFEGIPVEFPPSRLVIFIDRAQRRLITSMYLPIIQIGTPAAPHVYWTLLTDTLSNGTRGVRAIQDRSRFNIAPRILTQSETFIVPRLDSVSDQPLTYRLEPYAPTISLGDQVPPNPPLIPFRFPSGSLTVRIRKPTGQVDVIGPATFVQARMKSLVSRENGRTIDSGGGHIDDVYQLSTMDPRFEVEFTQDGLHVITLEGAIDDIWGNTWSGGGTYEVYVARTLALDTTVLPGTHFEVGDVFNPGLVVTPPVAADVEVRFQLAPNSDAIQLEEQVIRGRLNRFGYFQPAGNSIVLDQPGEYRVDVTATYRDDQGQMWAGSRTWGGVVAPVTPTIIAHGRRGIDSQQTIGPQWFTRDQLGIEVGSNHVPFPFNAGDVQWLEKSDSAIPLVTFQDPSRVLTDLLRQREFDNFGNFLTPLTFPGTFDERVVVGEAPLFSSRPDGIDPHLDPSKVDLWGYSYRSVQRPLVRVREEIGEDQLPPPYWRFNERYANQIGMGRNSDQPGEIKFQYSAVVAHGAALSQPQYGIHGSFFVLVPDDDPDGTRTFPPFQGNGGGPSGGPLFTLKGEDVDLFVHLTGIRPGSVLETGNTFALVGAVGPTLPARVQYTVTAPDNSQRSFSGRANAIGYYYDPADNFIVEQPGRYSVDLTVAYDGLTSAGQVTQPFPTGDVLGTASGRFFVYVVSTQSAPLAVDVPRNIFLTAPADFQVNATAPQGMTLTDGHMTAMIPGFVLEDKSLSGAGNSLTYQYDPVTLAQGVPVLDVDFFGTPVAADVVTISLFGEGTDADGSPTYAARVLTLHGTELLNLPPAAHDPTALRDLEPLE